MGGTLSNIIKQGQIMHEAPVLCCDIGSVSRCSLVIFFVITHGTVVCGSIDDIDRYKRTHALWHAVLVLILVMR